MVKKNLTNYFKTLSFKKKDLKINTKLSTIKCYASITKEKQLFKDFIKTEVQIGFSNKSNKGPVFNDLLDGLNKKTY